jgi:hypothetical protein
MLLSGKPSSVCQGRANQPEFAARPEDAANKSAKNTRGPEQSGRIRQANDLGTNKAYYF